jgi:hypothetical protein
MAADTPPPAAPPAAPVDELDALVELHRVAHANGWVAVVFTREDAERALGRPMSDAKWAMVSRHQLWAGLASYLHEVAADYLAAVMRDVAD